MEKIVVQSSKAPAPIGPYSQAIKTGNFLFASGQIALDPLTGALVVGTIETETHQVMKNIEAVLEEAGMSFDNVVKTTIFLMDMNDFAKVNAVYGSYFKSNFPARETVQVAGLPKGVKVEISVIAVDVKKE
jgi:2-iminobutanoate/2-iminopropanoate deaminase